MLPSYFIEKANDFVVKLTMSNAINKDIPSLNATYLHFKEKE